MRESPAQCGRVGSSANDIVNGTASASASSRERRGRHQHHIVNLKSVHELDGLVPEGWTLAKQIIKKAGCYVCIKSYLILIAFLACVVTRTQTTRYGD